MRLTEVENTDPLWTLLPMSKHLPKKEQVWVQVKPLSYKEQIRIEADVTTQAYAEMAKGVEVSDDDLLKMQVSEALSSRVLAIKGLFITLKGGEEVEVLHGADLVKYIPRTRATVAKQLVRELDKLIAAADPADKSFLPECPLLRGSEQGAGQKSSTSDATPASAE